MPLFQVNLKVYHLSIQTLNLSIYFSKAKSIPQEVFLEQSVLKTCNDFTGEYQCGSVILIKLLCNFIKIGLPNDCSPVNLLHVSRTLFYKNTYEGCQGLFWDSNKDFRRVTRNFLGQGNFLE